MHNKIKFYGLLNITKKQYVFAQVGTGILLAALWTWLIFGNLNDLTFGFGIWLIAVTTVGEIIETAVTLRKFRKA